jgi:hypothetical protein
MDESDAEILESVLPDLYGDTESCRRSWWSPATSRRRPLMREYLSDVARPSPSRSWRPNAGAGGSGTRDARRAVGDQPRLAASSERPQRAIARAAGTGRRPRSRAASLPRRVLRHESPSGHELRRFDGGLRRRAAQEERLPTLQRQGGPGQRRRGRHGRGGAPAPVHWTTSRPPRSSAAPTSSSSTGDYRSCTPPRRPPRRWAGWDRSSSRRSPSARSCCTDPGSSVPVVLERGSESLYLVQRIRDEAHRFAITFHRSKRGKSMVATTLEGIEGLGPARRDRLLEHLRVTRRAASAPRSTNSTRWPGCPSDVAARLYDHLQAPGRRGPRRGVHDE